jgi:hypothetical protein
MSETIRTTIDIPEPAYRKLKEQATRQGCSVRDLLARRISDGITKSPPAAKRRVKFPLIRSKGPKVYSP